ncbi:MAG: FecCD family ABC transporter permease [Candidatus Methanomethylophilaceae archaeon]|jgi:iron complex transport system permease protein
MTEEHDLNHLISVDRKIKRRAVVGLIVTFALMVTVFFTCIFVGSVDLDFEIVIDAMMGRASWSQNYIVKEIRIPRLICAAIVGASLSLSGMCMQALFKNPMASPSILGISSGAAFGAALYIAVGYGVFQITYGTTIFAFIMSGITMLLVYGLAYQKRGTHTIMLLLSGMAINALFSGLTSTIEFFSDADTVSSIVFWILGSFEKCNWASVKIIAVSAIVGSILVLYNSRELNLIAGGERKAKALGVNVKNVRIMLIVGTCLLVASSVSVCGIIGFVGLIIPHIFRTICGPDHKYLGPMCILGGALFMMLFDTIARSLMPPYELPVGIITSIIGAPFFMYIMRKREKDIWSV